MEKRKFGFDWEDIKGKMKKEEEAKAVSYGDSRIWKLKLNDQKGQAVIRFLPDTSGTPYRQYYQHWFDYETASGGVQKYVENCATTIKMPCPVCEKNRDLWNSAYKSDKDVASLRKRRVHYVSNIYVLKDDSNSENEGKVFLYDYGPQVYGIVKKAMFGPEEGDPEYDPDVEPKTFVPCDFYDGADFLLRSTIKKGTESLARAWNTYESSKFRPNKQFLDNLDDVEWEERVQAIMDKVYDLSEWINPDKYPDEAKVRAKLPYILGGQQKDVDPENEKQPGDDREDDGEDETSSPEPVVEQKVENESETDESYINDYLGKDK